MEMRPDRVVPGAVRGRLLASNLRSSEGLQFSAPTRFQFSLWREAVQTLRQRQGSISDCDKKPSLGGFVDVASFGHVLSAASERNIEC